MFVNQGLVWHRFLIHTQLAEEWSLIRRLLLLFEADAAVCENFIWNSISFSFGRTRFPGRIKGWFYFENKNHPGLKIAVDDSKFGANNKKVMSSSGYNSSTIRDSIWLLLDTRKSYVEGLNTLLTRFEIEWLRKSNPRYLYFKPFMSVRLPHVLLLTGSHTCHSLVTRLEFYIEWPYTWRFKVSYMWSPKSPTRNISCIYCYRMPIEIHIWRLNGPLDLTLVVMKAQINSRTFIYRSNIYPRMRYC